MAWLLQATLLAACVPETAKVAPDRRGPLTETRGVWHDLDTDAQWRSVVVAGRLSEIEEQVTLYGALRGKRRFFFDKDGQLTDLVETVERIEQPGEPILPDTAGTSASRVTRLTFVSFGPVLYEREHNGRPMAVSGREARMMFAHGQALRILALASRNQEPP